MIHLGPESISPPEPGPEPMQLENNRLTFAEQQRQLTRGLCLCCGAAGNVFTTCPIRPPCPMSLARQLNPPFLSSWMMERLPSQQDLGLPTLWWSTRIPCGMGGLRSRKALMERSSQRLKWQKAYPQVDGGLNENEISQQISSEDGRQNPPQTDTLRAEASTDRQQYCDLGIPDIHAALRELTATVTEQKEKNRELTATVIEQKENIRALETQLRDEMNKKNEEISNLTLGQEELRKENRDREIAFSASLTQSSTEYIGPFTTEITLTYRNVFTNIGNAYNPITGVFTAPLKGAYMFRISVFGYGPTPSGAAIYKNGEKVVTAYAHQPQYDLNSSNGVVLILEVGDVVYVRLWPNTKISDNENNHSTFSGYLLFPLR
ncbi:uncharacterized protein [Chanodichthys erythropterus]|uniref:uncharacterized protein isoform X2 n=1 Tax=Chanodichthys erythropterus TaxID=933992 RepID=UPI00351DD4B0